MVGLTAREGPEQIPYQGWMDVFLSNLTCLVKYYKGLGTNTAQEGKEYFSNLQSHRLSFVYDGNEDDKAINLAFSKDADERKKWIQEHADRWEMEMCRDHDDEDKIDDDGYDQVAQLAGYISEHTAYHHGENSLHSTISEYKRKWQAGIRETERRKNVRRVCKRNRGKRGGNKKVKDEGRQELRRRVLLTAHG
eukprot:754616-Hanusia_phi.AAC.2